MTQWEGHGWSRTVWQGRHAEGMSTVAQGCAGSSAWASLCACSGGHGAHTPPTGHLGQRGASVPRGPLCPWCTFTSRGGRPPAPSPCMAKRVPRGLCRGVYATAIQLHAPDGRWARTHLAMTPAPHPLRSYSSPVVPGWHLTKRPTPPFPSQVDTKFYWTRIFPVGACQVSSRWCLTVPVAAPHGKAGMAPVLITA